jgi:hypothetical protein
LIAEQLQPSLEDEKLVDGIPVRELRKLRCLTANGMEIYPAERVSTG